jgi:2-keto-4-pentenoate hydratase
VTSTSAAMAQTSAASMEREFGMRPDVAQPAATIVGMLARELISLDQYPREVSPFSERYAALTAEDGYQAARALHEHRLARGWRAVGRKIGFTNRTIWQRYGVHEPIWGTVYDRTLSHANDNKARVSLAGLVNPRIEPEICFRLRAAPARERLVDCIEWMAHSVEIVQCPHPNWKLRLADCTANNGLHGRLVIGTPQPLPADAEERLPALEVELYRAGELIDRGVAANVLGSPLAALAHLVELLSRQPEAQRLAPGEIVTTGVITDAHPVAAGECWSTRLMGMPIAPLSIEFA